MTNTFRFTTTGHLTVLVAAAALMTAACADGLGTPTGPSPSASTLGSGVSAAQQQTSHGQGSAQQLPLLLTKTCDAIDHCTVVDSQDGPIPAGSEVDYFGPLLETRTTSSILVRTPQGDTATGHCSVSYRSGVGTCVLTDGTGALAGIRANLAVSSAFDVDPAGVFTWAGTYRFVGRD